MNTTKLHTPEEKWEIAAQIVDRLQNDLDEIKMTTKGLVFKLSEYFPVKGSRLSVIYRTYVTPIQYRVLIEDGSSKNILIEDSSLYSGASTIKGVIIVKCENFY